MKSSHIALSILIIFSIIAFALILLDAMGRGVGSLIALLVGVVLLCLIAAGLIAFTIRAYERWTDTRVKANQAADEHEYRMAKEGLILRQGRFMPRKQFALPEPPKPTPQIDPRHELLVSLCLLTIRSDIKTDKGALKYGPTSEKLMSADDAQELRGNFADRNNWDAASKYGQELGVCYTMIGGAAKNQGLRVGNIGAGGRTVVDLLEVLRSRNLVLDSAVNALPGVMR